MIRMSDEIIDHKDSLVKTRLLGLWEHQLVIRHAQGARQFLLLPYKEVSEPRKVLFLEPKSGS